MDSQWYLVVSSWSSGFGQKQPVVTILNQAAFLQR